MDNGGCFRASCFRFNYEFGNQKKFAFETTLIHGAATRAVQYYYTGLIILRLLALDHGTKRIGVAVSDEMKMIASPLEYIPAEPFADFLVRLKEIIREKEIELILIGMPRNMDGSYGPAALKVQEFIAALKGAITISIKTLDERLTTVQAQKSLIRGNVRRKKRKEKVDKTAAALLLQSYLDSLPR